MSPEVLRKLFGFRLDFICESERFQWLDRHESYLAGSQYLRRRYDWDANMVGYAGDIPLPAQFYVPLSARRPSVRRDLPKLIVKRLTAMAFGREQWPDLRIQGDTEAEDYAKALVEASKLPAKMVEARGKGGCAGTVCASFSFVEGAPKVRIHEAKHCRVLRWKDRDEFVVAEAIKVFRYTQNEIVDGKPREVAYYSARYWDEKSEIVWNPIPEALAKSGAWVAAVQSFEVEHGYGECPFYWCQNLPDSEREDGLSDFDGMLDRFDAINAAASATNKGTISNVDPTLVIKDSQTANQGVVRKGSDVAIYSTGGAEYLELEGTAVEAASKWIGRLEQWCLDEAGVVLADPATIASKAQSGEALKITYMPMAAQCDILREQYGNLLIRLVAGMLNAARLIYRRPPGEIVATTDGRRLQATPTVVLAPRYDEETIELPDGTRSKTVVAVERTPGVSSAVSLNWHSYFPPTPKDIQMATDAAVKAKGALIADKTAVAFTSSMFGVKDIESEVIAIEAERQLRAESMPSPDDDLFSGKGGKGSKDDESDDTDKDDDTKGE